MAVNSLRVLQIGMGPHGRGWAKQVIPEIKEVDVVAYVDTDPYALDALREVANVPAEKCFESMREAIAATQPQAAPEPTPPPSPAPAAGPQLPPGRPPDTNPQENDPPD